MSYISEALQRIAVEVHAQVACKGITGTSLLLDFPQASLQAGDAADSAALDALQSWQKGHGSDPAAQQPKRCANESDYYCNKVRNDLVRFLNHRPDPNPEVWKFLDEEAFLCSAHPWMPPEDGVWDDAVDGNLLRLVAEATEATLVLQHIVQYTHSTHRKQMHAFLEHVAEAVPKMPWHEFLYMDLSQKPVLEFLKTARPSQYPFLVAPSVIADAAVMVVAARKFRIDFQAPGSAKQASDAVQKFLPHMLKEVEQKTVSWGDKEFLLILEAYGMIVEDGDGYRPADWLPENPLSGKSKTILSVQLPETADVFGVRYHVPAVQKYRFHEEHLHIADLLYSGPDENFYQVSPLEPGYRVQAMKELLEKPAQRAWLYGLHPQAEQLPADWVLRMFATEEALKADARGY